jgi:hypothetical protein
MGNTLVVSSQQCMPGTETEMTGFKGKEFEQVPVLLGRMHVLGTMSRARRMEHLGRSRCGL